MLSKNLALCLIITLLFGSALASSISAAVSYEKEELVSSTIKKWQPKISANEFPSHQPSIESGKEVYKMNCAMCHGHEPNEVLTKDQLRSKSPEEQYIIIKNGNAKGMPAFKNKLSRDEMWDALMYVRAGVLGYYPLNSDELAK